MHSLVEDVAVQPRRRSSAVVGLAVAPEVVVVVHVVHVEDEAMVKGVEMQQQEEEEVVVAR